MAIYVYASGKTYTDVDQVRATIGRPELGNVEDYRKEKTPRVYVDITGLSGVLDNRYIHDAANPWENAATTG